MELTEYLRAIRHHWWVVVLLLAVGVAAGIFAGRQEPVRYRASVTFFVATRAGDSVASAAQGDQFAQRRVNSYVELLGSDRLAQMVAEDLTAEASTAEVRRSLRGRADLDTVLLSADATTESRGLALAIAESVAEAFPVLVAELEGSAGGQSSVNLEVVSGPGVRRLPSGARADLLLRSALGGLAGLGAAVLLHLRDRAVRREEQLVEVGAGPLLGLIPNDPTAKGSPLPTDDGADAQRIERLRHLRTSLEFISVDRAIQVLVVTSSVAGEGKSFLSVNLAEMLAVQGREVLVVEADLRRPTMEKYFQLRHRVGLADAIAGRVAVREAIQPSGSHPRLSVMASGELPPNPAELLGSAACAELIEDLRTRFDVIVLNTPPVLPVTDGAVLATRADGVVLVAQYGRTSDQQLARSAATLRRVGAHFLGSVLNMVPARELRSVGDYERYDPISAGPEHRRQVNPYTPSRGTTSRAPGP